MHGCVVFRQIPSKGERTIYGDLYKGLGKHRNEVSTVSK